VIAFLALLPTFLLISYAEDPSTLVESSAMQSVTEETLVLAKQPQKLLKEYHVPTAKVADMIREAMVEIKQLEKEWLGEARPVSPSQVWFAGRRHRYQNKL
jgi:hypothetical protein